MLKLSRATSSRIALEGIPGGKMCFYSDDASVISNNSQNQISADSISVCSRYHMYYKNMLNPDSDILHAIPKSPWILCKHFFSEFGQFCSKYNIRSKEEQLSLIRKHLHKHRSNLKNADFDKLIVSSLHVKCDTENISYIDFKKIIHLAIAFPIIAYVKGSHICTKDGNTSYYLNRCKKRNALKCNFQNTIYFYIERLFKKFRMEIRANTSHFVKALTGLKMNSLSNTLDLDMTQVYRRSIKKIIRKLEKLDNMFRRKEINLSSYNDCQELIPELADFNNLEQCKEHQHKVAQYFISLEEKVNLKIETIKKLSAKYEEKRKLIKEARNELYDFRRRFSIYYYNLCKKNNINLLEIIKSWDDEDSYSDVYSIEDIKYEVKEEGILKHVISNCNRTRKNKPSEVKGKYLIKKDKKRQFN